MKFTQELVSGTLLRRYKRFLADVELENGEMVTAHTPNTGSMMGCCEPGSPVWLSRSDNPKRKYALSWEIVGVEGDTLVGINTGLPNRLVAEAIDNGVVKELQGYADLRKEVRYGKEKSRIDILLEDEQLGLCYVEVKNVTLVNDGHAFFPDAVSSRGAKHLRELAAMCEAGHRGVIFFCVQRVDALDVSPADDIDPEYGKTLREAMASGVEALAYRAEVSPQEISLLARLPVIT